MKPRAFKLHPGESASLAIGRMYRYIRELKRGYQPAPKAKSRANLRLVEKAGQHSHLRLVKG